MSVNAHLATADAIAALKQSTDEQFDEAVDVGFLEVAAEADLVADDNTLDTKSVAQRVYEVLRTKRVTDIDPANDDRRDPLKSSSKEELAAFIFPTVPTGSEADANAVVAKIREKCLAAVWNVSQTGERGKVQKLLRADNLILVRGSVFRDSITINDGIYVSTHPEVVLRELLAPRLEKLRKLTEAIEGEFEMVTDRAPELAGVMRAAIEAALVEASAKLPVATLGHAASNGQKALDK